MPRTCLVHVFHPGNFLAGAASVVHYGRLTGRRPARVRTVVHHPGFDAENLEHSLYVVGRMAAQLGWEAPVGLDQARMAAMAAAGGPEGRALFRQAVGLERADEIHYPHDVVGRLAALARDAFPEARLVLFGDVLGAVFNKAFHLAMALGEPFDEAVRRGRAHAAAGDRLTPDAACLVLPVDQTGDMLDPRTLRVVPRSLARELLDTIASGLSELRACCAELLRQTPGPRALYLTESIHEMNFATFEDAVALQEAMIRANVPEGTRSVLIKEHPVTMSDVAQALRERLRPDYEVRIVDRRYGRFPIEFFRDLIGACHIVTWSSASLTLRHLYGARTSRSLTPELIDRYIFEPQRCSMRNSDRMVSAPLARLDAWDGRGPLWSGDYGAWEEYRHGV